MPPAVDSPSGRAATVTKCQAISREGSRMMGNWPKAPRQPAEQNKIVKARPPAGA